MGRGAVTSRPIDAVVIEHVDLLAVSGDLPPQLTRLMGREVALGELRAQVWGARLLTCNAIRRPLRHCRVAELPQEGDLTGVGQQLQKHPSSPRYGWRKRWPSHASWAFRRGSRGLSTSWQEPDQAVDAALAAIDRLGGPTNGGALGTGAPVLTPRELAMLELVCEGHTNREIAAALYISPSTAGLHVSNILRKLGATRRVDAAGVAHRLGLLPIS